MVDIYRTRVTLTTPQGSSLLTHYWTTSNPTPDTATATEALARVRACLNSAAALIASGSSVAFDTNVEILDAATGTLINAASGATPAAVVFSATGDIMPGLVQGLARFNTGTFFAGRAVRGRMFLPGLTEILSQSPGVPTASYISGWNAALGLLSTTIVTPISQVVWHRPKGSPPAGGQAFGIASRSVASTWSLLKSRR